MPAKIDGVLEKVGAAGKYQWLQLLIAGLGSFSSAPHFLSIVFHSITPNHRCKIPGLDNDTYFPQNDLHNLSIYDWIPTKDDGKLDSCKIYTDRGGTTDNATSGSCSEYVFDKSVYWGVTLNEEFGMVCVNIWQGTLVKVVFTIGLVAGAIVVGMAADRFGRRIVNTAAMFIGGAAGTAAMFSVNYSMMAALRFITAMCFVGVALLAHVINMEIVAPSARTYTIAFRSLFWPSGTMFTSVLAYYFQDWNWYQLSISVIPIVFGIIMVLFLKETPHFLVTKGRHEEAEALFKHMAKMNGRTLPDNFMDELKEDEESAVTEKLKVILKAPVLIKRTIIFFYLWFIAGMGFYGLGFNVGNLTGSVYVNNVLSGAAELPQVLFVLASKKIGRKIPTIACLLLGGTALLSNAFLYAYANLGDYDYVLTIVAMIGKYGITVVFLFDYFWSSEVFPTTLRATMVGLCSLFARVGTILSPIIVDMNLYVQTIFGPNLGALIFGTTMFIGAVLAFFLPETNKQRIPETIAEANVFLTKRYKSGEGDEDKEEMDGNEMKKFKESSNAELVPEKF